MIPKGTFEWVMRKTSPWSSGIKVRFAVGSDVKNADVSALLNGVMADPWWDEKPQFIDLETVRNADIGLRAIYLEDSQGGLHDVHL